MFYDLGYALNKNRQLVTLNKRALSKKIVKFSTQYLRYELKYRG
jgi:hypothetical protein